MNMYPDLARTISEGSLSGKLLLLEHPVEWIKPQDHFEIIESKEKDEYGNKRLTLVGLHSRYDAKNKNGRTYRRGLWESILRSDQITDILKNRGMVGFIEHPNNPVGNLAEAACLTSKLAIDKNGEITGVTEVLSTPHGNIIRKLVEDNVRLGLSSRGTGTVDANGYVNDDYVLRGFDVVGHPSTYGAFPKAVVADKSANETNETVEETPIEVRTSRTAASPTENHMNEQNSGLDKFRLLESRFRELTDDLSGNLPKHTLSERSDKLLDLSRQFGALAKDDENLHEECKQYKTEISAARKQITEMKASNTPSSSVQAPAPTRDDPKLGDPINSGAANTGGGTVTKKAYNEALAEAAAARKLIGVAVTQLEQSYDAVVTLGESLEHAYGVNEKQSEELKGLKEEHAALKKIVDRLIKETSQGDVAIAKAAAKKKFPKLSEKFLDRCESVEEVEELVEAFGGQQPRTDLPNTDSLHRSDDDTTAASAVNESDLTETKKKKSSPFSTAILGSLSSFTG